MNLKESYRRALFYALSLHLILVGLLMTDGSHERPVLTVEKKNLQAQSHTPQPEIVQAVSIDADVVKQTVEKLRAEKKQQQLQEAQRQKRLVQEAERARQARIKEQQQLAKLKEEAERIAIARKKQAEEEKKRLKQLAEEKAREAKKLAELKKEQEKLKQQEAQKKKQQEAEEKKLAELRKKQAEEKAKADKMRADAELKRKKAAEQAALDRDKQTRIAGEVDKYKALIINAISRQWILPDNVDPSLSSQFRIRLAPDGSVLEVSLMRSSGDPILDRSAQTAIYKASPLPVPSDPDAFNTFRDINLTVRPEQIRG